ncbi:hypothetical protein ACMFMG_003383 [Clarireedia jacksonii]
MADPLAAEKCYCDGTEYEIFSVTHHHLAAHGGEGGSGVGTGGIFFHNHNHKVEGTVQSRKYCAKYFSLHRQRYFSGTAIHPSPVHRTHLILSSSHPLILSSSSSSSSSPQHRHYRE